MNIGERTTNKLMLYATRMTLVKNISVLVFPIDVIIIKDSGGGDVDMSAFNTTCAVIIFMPVSLFAAYITPDAPGASDVIFTVHSDPTDSYPFTEAELDKLIIPYGQRKDWKDRLFGLGINEASLFPDLDSIATQIEWEVTSSH